MSRGLRSRTDSRHVKLLLKRLYLCVHPDLFGTHPEKQSVNQASFKLLQSAYEDYISDKRQHRHKRNIVFYVRNQRAKLSDVVQEEFRKVSATFAGKEGFLRSFFGLLKDAGLNPELPKDTSAQATGVPEYVGIDIIPFLAGVDGAAQRSREISSQRLMSDRLKEDKLDEARILRSQLKRSLGLALEFDGIAPDIMPALVRRIAAAFDRLDDKVIASISSGTVVVDSGFEVGLRQASSGGRILHLGACASESLWLQHLSSPSFQEACSEAQSLCVAIQHAEEVAARALNVRFVLTDGDPSAEQRPQYYNLLKSLGEASVTSPATVGLSLMVKLSGKEFSSNRNNGVLYVPLDASTDDIRKYVLSHGPDVAHDFGRLSRESEVCARLEDSIRRSIRIRRISQHDSISRKQYLSACRRLMRHCAVLRIYLDGLEVVIGDECHVDERDGTVTIPHDFDVSTTYNYRAKSM